MGARQVALQSIAARIAALTPPHPLRVAIDGIDAARKTTLADELAALLAPCGRPVILASVDSFHRPRAERYRRFGALSPEGFYQDAFDYPALRSDLLGPLAPDGNRRYRRECFDVVRDEPLTAEWLTATDDAILLFDGAFALRPELAPTWDFSIFVHIPLALSLARALERDLALHGSPEAVRESYENRYLPAQARYLATVRPMDLADVIVENSDPARPIVRFRGA